MSSQWINLNFIPLVLLVVGSFSCSPTSNKITGNVDGWGPYELAQWDFNNPNEYEYNDELIEVTGGIARVKGIESIHDTQAEFEDGTMVGVRWDSQTNRLTLDADTSRGLGIDQVITENTDSFLGYWKFDESLADSSGKGHHAQFGDGVSFLYSADSKVGSHSLAFSDSSHFLELPGLATAFTDVNQGSFCFWVNRDVLGDEDRELLVLYGDTDNWIRLFGSHDPSGALTLEIRGGGSTASAKAPLSSLSVNKWSHLCGTWDSVGSRRISLFLNGVRVGVQTNIPAFEGGLSRASIGSHSLDTLSSFIGLVDEAAVWSRALSNHDVNLLYRVQRLRYGGYYQSKVIDIGTVGPWSGIGIKTPLPFGKELLAAAGSEDSTDYSDIQPGLMDELVGYWPMNGSLQNESDNTNGGVSSGSVTHINDGVLGKAVRVGVTGQIATSDNMDLPNWTVAVWVRSSEDPNGNNDSGPLSKPGNFSMYWNHSDPANRGALVLNFDGAEFVAGFGPLSSGEWYHLAASYDGAILLLTKMALRLPRLLHQPVHPIRPRLFFLDLMILLVILMK